MKVSPITQTASSSSDNQGTSLATTATTSISSTVMTPSVSKVQMKTKAMEKKMEESQFYLVGANLFYSCSQVKILCFGIQK